MIYKKENEGYIGKINETEPAKNTSKKNEYDIHSAQLEDDWDRNFLDKKNIFIDSNLFKVDTSSYAKKDEEANKARDKGFQELLDDIVEDVTKKDSNLDKNIVKENIRKIFEASVQTNDAEFLTILNPFINRDYVLISKGGTKREIKINIKEKKIVYDSSQTQNIALMSKPEDPVNTVTISRRKSYL